MQHPNSWGLAVSQTKLPANRRLAVSSRTQANVGTSPADPAIEALADLIEFGESEQIRLRAAKAILDYAGYQPYRRPERITTEMLESELVRLEAEISELDD